jgi:hypothetical protein
MGDLDRFVLVLLLSGAGSSCDPGRPPEVHAPTAANAPVQARSAVPQVRADASPAHCGRWIDVRCPRSAKRDARRHDRLRPRPVCGSISGTRRRLCGGQYSAAVRTHARRRWARRDKRLAIDERASGTWISGRVALGTRRAKRLRNPGEHGARLLCAHRAISRHPPDERVLPGGPHADALRSLDPSMTSQGVQGVLAQRSPALELRKDGRVRPRKNEGDKSEAGRLP